jgi:hypothetical protein
VLWRKVGLKREKVRGWKKKLHDGEGEGHPITCHEDTEGVEVQLFHLFKPGAKRGHALVLFAMGNGTGINCTGSWLDHAACLDGCVNLAPTRVRTLHGARRKNTLYPLRYPGPLHNQRLQDCKCITLLE